MATERSLTILKRFLDNREPTLEEAIEAFTPSPWATTTTSTSPAQPPHSSPPDGRSP